MTHQSRPSGVRLPSVIFFVAAMFLTLVFMSGCAKMNIGVDVYKGDLLLPDDSKLARSVGVARFAYDFTGRYLDALNQELKDKKVQDKPPYNLHSAGVYLINLRHVFEQEGIEDLWKQYETTAAAYAAQGAGPAQSGSTHAPTDVSAQRNAARSRLENALARFGNMCISAGQQTGLARAIEMRSWADFVLPAPILNMLVSGAVAETDFRISEGILLEQSGRFIVSLVADVEDTSQRKTVARLMQSSTPGLIITAIDRAYSAKLAGLPETFETLDWSTINNVHVDGWGNEQFVVAKDEIGNWNIKSVQSDPQDVVNAVFDTTAAMVNIVGSRYGITLNQNSSPSDGTLNGQQTSQFLQDEMKASEAQDVLAQLRSARQALRASLTRAETLAASSNNSQAAIDFAIEAAKGYAARVNEIEFDSSSASPNPNPAAPGGSTAPSGSNVTGSPKGTSPSGLGSGAGLGHPAPNP
jgi:hypothetical protein